MVRNLQSNKEPRKWRKNGTIPMQTKQNLIEKKEEKKNQGLSTHSF